MAHIFTSLRHPVEKLLEAEYFLAGMTRKTGLEFQFELNAFLSASRSVTLLMQKAMADVLGFHSWYEAQQVGMKADHAMRFFIELRNVSQKQGPVSYVGGALMGGGWTYRFVAGTTNVPAALVGKDISVCCADHLSKLAKVLIECSEAFPFQSCPYTAFSEAGMAALNFEWFDVEVALGLPAGYTAVVDIAASEKFRILRREVEPLDRGAITRIVRGDFRDGEVALSFPASTGRDLIDDIAATMAERGKSHSTRDVYLESIMRRIADSQG